MTRRVTRGLRPYLAAHQASERRLRRAGRNAVPAADGVGRPRPARGRGAPERGDARLPAGPRERSVERDRRRARRDGGDSSRREAGRAARPHPRRSTAGRRDRPRDQLDDLGDPGAAAGTGARPEAGGALPAPPPGPVGRLVVEPRRAARLERHRRRGRGPPLRGSRRARRFAARSPISRRLRNRDGGFELTPGRGSDAQSTAWAIQAFAAGHRKPPAGSLAYLKRLRRKDGSFRYSTRYATTPVWVTAQVLPALSRRPFPL